MVLLRLGRVFRDAAAEEVGLCFGGERRECVKGGGLLLRWWGWEQCLGVGGKVLAPVGGVEAFWEHDQGGSGFGGFEDSGTSAGDVCSFVGAWRGSLSIGC